MPPPIFTDAYIRKVCPENHPIPLKQIKMLESKKQPKYLANGNSGIKYVPHPISTPKRVDYIARSISREIQGKDKEKLVDVHQQQINKVIGEHSKLRGRTNDDGGDDDYGMNSMNMLSSLLGLGAGYAAYEYMSTIPLPNDEPQPEYDEENPFQVEPDTPQRWPRLDPRPPPGYRTPQSDTLSLAPQSDALSLPSGGGSERRLSFGSESPGSMVSTPEQNRTPEQIRTMNEDQLQAQKRTQRVLKNLQTNVKYK